MKLSPCRFKLPLMDNDGQPIDGQVILDLHRDLLAEFQGFTIQPISEGRWRSREGRLYQEQVVEYEIAIPRDKISFLRDVVYRLGQRLGQLAMYFDAPAPSVEIIEITPLPPTPAEEGGSSNEPRPDKTTRRRGKKDRPPS